MELEHLFNEADKILVEKIDKNLNVKEIVKYIRANIDKEVLNICCCLNNLSIGQMNLLDTKTREVKFSMDSFLKNGINHSELCFEDYKRIN